MSNLPEEPKDERVVDVGPAARSGRGRTIVSIWLLGATLVLAIFSVANTIVEGNENEQTDFELRQNQYNNCVLTANVLREDIRDEFVDLKEKGIIPPFQAVADLDPEGESPATKILNDAVATLDRRILTIDKRIPNVRCLELYPPLDGQVFTEPELPAGPAD